MTRSRALRVGIDIGGTLTDISIDLDGPAQTIRLRASDTTDQWTVRTEVGSAHLTRACDQVDATATATAPDLLLLLWGRRSSNQIQVDGHMTALHRFLT
jgi:hypothetical protein